MALCRSPVYHCKFAKLYACSNSQCLSFKTQNEIRLTSHCQTLSHVVLKKDFPYYP